MSSLEVYLGNWGTVVCLNEQHREYMIAAWNCRDIESATNSWHGAWLYPAMESEYNAALVEARAKCDALWNAIPDRTDDLIKSHSS